MDDTTALAERLLSQFEKAMTNKQSRKIEDYYQNNKDNDQVLNNVITELIKNTKSNLLYRKERFLKIVWSCPGYSNSESDNSSFIYVAEKANALLEETRAELSEQLLGVSDTLKNNELKFYLYDKNKNDLVLKPNTISAWFNSKNHSPSRHILFLLSFALQLPLAKSDSDDYFSHESLFYRAFAQRSHSRNADEICMIYCKMTRKSYATALKMYLDFLQKKRNIEKKDFSHSSAADDNNTRVIFTGVIYKGKKLMELNEQEFVEFLIENAEYLDFKSSKINEYAITLQNGNPDFLKKIIEAYGDTVDSKFLEEILDDYYNLFQNNQFSYMRKTYLDNKNIISDMKRSNRKRLYSKTGNEIPESLIPLASIKENDNQNIDFKDFAIDVLPLQEYFYTIYRYSNDYYTKQRKRWIFLLFLFYWQTYADLPKNLLKSKRKELISNYILFTDTTLRSYYFSKLLPYNNYDLLFILCAQRDNPIKEYFTIMNIMYKRRENEHNPKEN